MKLQHFFEGFLTVTVEVPFPTRLLNLCALERISFRGLMWHSDTEISLLLPPHQLSRFRGLVERLGGHLVLGEARGLPAVVHRFRHRVGFLLGLGISLFAVAVLSRYVMVVDIIGNQEISTGEIRVALRKAGLDVGAHGKDLLLSQVSQEALSHLEGVSWMSINLYGTRAEVAVMESVQSPEIIPRDGFYDMVSTVEGLITQVQVHRGEALVEVGDMVLPGEVLISGLVELEPPLYSLEPSMWMEEVASGVVMARTWRQIQAVTPLEVWVKGEGGMAMNGFGLSVFGRVVEVFHHDVLLPSGTEKVRHYTGLPFLSAVPVAWIHTEEARLGLFPEEVDVSLAVEMLEASLLEELQARIGETGEVLAVDYAVSVEDGLVSVTLLSECLEDIGVRVVGSPRDFGEGTGVVS